MANTLEYPEIFVNLIDQIFKRESLTASLGDSSGIVNRGAGFKKLKYAHYEMDGLSDYNRGTGYEDGDVSMTWKEIVPNYDRGKRFMVDTMDNTETFDMAFGRLGAEFMRTKVIPELDAFTFAKLAGKSGATLNQADIADGATFLDALVAAKTLMDEAEIPPTERILYATPTLMNALINMDTNKSKAALSSFSQTIEVPQTRFYTVIDMKNKSDGKGGYAKNSSGKNINFMIAYRPAVIKQQIHMASDIIDPANNPSHDAYIMKFRSYGIVETYENKVKGIYVSHASA